MVLIVACLFRVCQIHVSLHLSILQMYTLCRVRFYFSIGYKTSSRIHCVSLLRWYLTLFNGEMKPESRGFNSL